MSSYVLPPPQRRVVARFRTPGGPEMAEFISEPGAGIAYAGLVPGQPPKTDRGVEVPRASFSDAWTPIGPTLEEAQARGDMEEAAVLAGLIDAGPVNYKVLAGVGLAALVGYYLWRKR